MRAKYSNLILLILAGELIFALPFHITRFFKPTVLEVFQITNTDLGDAFALYGILALLCYFPGGYLADKYPPRKLISLSLFFYRHWRALFCHTTERNTATVRLCLLGNYNNFVILGSFDQIH